MSDLTFEKLSEAVAGGAVALRAKTTLQPAGGEGDKVFPPTYAERGAEHKYAVEERQGGDKSSKVVLLDSVASQANRAELALLEGWRDQELSFPVPYVDFAVDEDVSDIGEMTVLEAPHRLADAIFRDSLLDGTLFRLSDMGQAITDATPRNASALFRYSPTALLFGMWDSTGPKGGLGSKFQRAYVSEIVGMDAVVGRKVSSRIDPLQIEKLNPDEKAFKHEDPHQVWTFDEAEAEKDIKDKPIYARRRDKSGGDEAGSTKPKSDDGQPATINHGNVPPQIDDQSGGVTISKAVQTTVISLAALRRLRFSGHDRAAESAARTAVAALGVAAIAYQHQHDHDLRSRCLLIPEHAPRLELVGRDGSAPEVVNVDRSIAQDILARASEQAARAGLGWETEKIRLVPAPKLVELIKRSRQVAAAEQPAE